MRSIVWQGFWLALAAAGSLTAAVRAENPAELRVATFQSDATLPIGAWLYSEPLVTVEHPLLAKGVVIEHGRDRYVLCALDWCTLRNYAYDRFRQQLAKGAGTDPSRVAVQCVHQHTAPSYDGGAQRLLDAQPNPPQIRDLKFLDEVTQRLAAAVAAALGRLEPCDSIGVGQARVERVASARRLIGPDGKIRTRWSSCRDPKLIAMPEGDIDPMLKTITFSHGKKPLARLHYYATHPQTYYRDGRASYDVPGIARERLQEKEGVFQVYFTGCAGDVTMGKYNNGTPAARAELAERLYQGMEAAVAATKFAPIGPVTWRSVPVQFERRADKGADPAKDRAMIADPKADPKQRYGAAGRLVNTERLSRPIELCSLQLGSIYLLHLPGEPLIAFQHYAQQAAPAALVAVAGYGLGNPGYLCTEKAFTEGGYEPSASAVVPKSEAVLKQGIRQLLGIE